MRDDLARAIQLIHPPREVAEWDEMSADVADLILMRLAHVENVKIVAAIEAGLKIARRNFRNGCLRRGRFLAAYSAKLSIVNQLRDARGSRSRALDAVLRGGLEAAAIAVAADDCLL